MILAVAVSRRENSSFTLFCSIATGTSIGPSRLLCAWIIPCDKPGEIGVPWIISVKAFFDMMMVEFQ